MFGSKSSLSLQSVFATYHRYLNHQFNTSTQTFLMNLIFNEQTQVLTTFDMNQIASFTFNSKVCTEIFECIDYALTHPIEFTVLSLTKTLVLVHHLAIYASQQAANQVWMLKADIELLTQYNTVLYALKDKQSILAKMNRIKGGSVDRGLPVRQAALQIHHLLQDITLFRQLRNQSQDPDSLVPIGSKEQVGFVSDEVRQGILEDRIKVEELERKKNASSSVFKGVGEKSLQVGGGGYGAGLGNTDAKANTVVGAAYTMEDMIHIAMKQSKQKLEMKNYKRDGYRDNIDDHDVSNDALTLEEKNDLEHLEKLKEELKIQKANEGVRHLDDSSNIQSHNDSRSSTDLIDFLDYDHTSKKTADTTRDFISQQTRAPPSSTMNRLPYDEIHDDHFTVDNPVEELADDDILGLSNVSTSNAMNCGTASTTANSIHSNDAQEDLWSMMATMNVDDVSHTSATPLFDTVSSNMSPFDAFDVVPSQSHSVTDSSTPSFVSTNNNSELGSSVIRNGNGLMEGVANELLPSPNISVLPSPPPLPTYDPPLPPPMEGYGGDSFVVKENNHSETDCSVTSNMLMTTEQMQNALKTMTPQQMQEFMLLQQQMLMKMMHQNENKP